MRSEVEESTLGRGDCSQPASPAAAICNAGNSGTGCSSANQEWRSPLIGHGPKTTPPNHEAQRPFSRPACAATAVTAGHGGHRQRHATTDQNEPTDEPSASAHQLVARLVHVCVAGTLAARRRPNDAFVSTHPPVAPSAEHCQLEPSRPTFPLPPKSNSGLEGLSPLFAPSTRPWQAMRQAPWLATRSTWPTDTSWTVTEKGPMVCAPAMSKSKKQKYQVESQQLQAQLSMAKKAVRERVGRGARFSREPLAEKGALKPISAYPARLKGVQLLAAPPSRVFTFTIWLLLCPSRGSALAHSRRRRPPPLSLFVLTKKRVLLDLTAATQICFLAADACAPLRAGPSPDAHRLTARRWSRCNCRAR